MASRTTMHVSVDRFRRSGATIVTGFKLMLTDDAFDEYAQLIVCEASSMKMKNLLMLGGTQRLTDDGLVVDVWFVELSRPQVAVILGMRGSCDAFKTCSQLTFWFPHTGRDGKVFANNHLEFGTAPPDPTTMQRPTDDRPTTLSITHDDFCKWAESTVY